MSGANAAHLDRDLADLPEGLRWREWMMRAEAAIFASPKPVSRETLAALVGDACRLDALLSDINEELRGRPYEIVFVAGGFQFRTRPRCAETLRALAGAKDAEPPSFTRLEMLALSAIALIKADVVRVSLNGRMAPGSAAPRAAFLGAAFFAGAAFFHRSSLRHFRSSHSSNLDQRRRAEALRTAMATAFF